MSTRFPTIQVHGPAATHNQACAVLHQEEAAVLDLDSGVFEPSWIAQSRGWHLVQAKTLLQRLAIRWLWSKP